jgi:hypothetical protein
VNNRKLGAARLLIAVYGIFALSASARAIYQLLRKFEDAPLAYTLSALAAIVYVFATISLAKDGRIWRKIAMYTLGFELLGVVVVGSLSFIRPELFSHPSVWSGFGIGYGFIPLLLPILGLIWLWRSRVRDN